ncbi:MAG: hypothetical protein JWR16_242 [Nevskia sp.]|nr:hypothetical protein [Nevskia sp.]
MKIQTVSLWLRCLLAVSACGAASAHALSLREAAELAVQNDPRMHAAEQAVAASAANVDVARAGYLPSASVSAGSGVQRVYLGGDFPAGIPVPGLMNPYSASVKASQPLYSGGLTGAQMADSRGRLEGSQQDEVATRQQLLLTAATAYLDVMRERTVVELNQKNVLTLQQALDDTNKRFEAGEATRTDVSQANARRAEAEASLKRASAAARVSAAAFVRAIGTEPQNLSSDWPIPLTPASLDQALSAAGLTPSVLAADAQRKSAHAQIAAARAAFLPKVSIDGSASTQDDSQFALDRYDYWSVQLKATLPIYAGGANAARLAAARAAAAQADAQVDDARHAAIQSITQAWANSDAAAEIIAAYQADADASASALDSVQKELQVGTRTTLDLLDAERDLLSAQVNLAGSKHDRAVAGYQLLAACGQLHLGDIAP